jgi:hypothetical protein
METLFHTEQLFDLSRCAQPGGLTAIQYVPRVTALEWPKLVVPLQRRWEGKLVRRGQRKYAGS